MKYSPLLILILISTSFGQISVSDIQRMSNQQLDEIRKEFQLQSQANQSSVVKTVLPSFSADKSDEVLITSEAIPQSLEEFFGYNYFKKDISFFDNIPTPVDYKLGPGDEIIVSLWGEANSRTSYTINKDGMIFINVLGYISLSNYTISTAEEILKKELSKIYSTLLDEENPTQLMLSLGKLKSINIYFSGLVENPGINLIHPFSDIFSAIIQAGGVDTNGSLRKIQLIRNDKVIKTIDFYSFFMDGKNSFSDTKLLDGDVIHIPNISKRVIINGAVKRPGAYELIDNENIDDLIQFSAGLESSAQSKIIISQLIPMKKRVSDDISRNSIAINFDDRNSIVLNDGDKLSIPNIAVTSSDVLVQGRVKLPGKYPSYKSTLKDILDLAGGFEDPTYNKSILKDKIIVIRKDNNQKFSKEFTVKFSDSENFKIEPQDVVLVYENIFYDKNFGISIQGEVNIPGYYNANGPITVGEAIKLAGGFTEEAFKDAIRVTGLFNNSQDSINGNYLNVNLDTNLINQATISVPTKTNVVNVVGNIYNPGLLSLNNTNITVSRAIEMAGGFKQGSLKRKVYIIKANGKIIKPNMLGKKIRILKAGDTVVVPKNENENRFNINSFIADLTSTLTNIVAIIAIIDNNN